MEEKLYELFFTGDVAVNLATGSGDHVAVLVDIIASRSMSSEAAKMKQLMMFSQQQHQLKSVSGAMSGASNVSKYLLNEFADDGVTVSMTLKTLKELSVIEKKKSKEIKTCTLEELVDEWMEVRNEKMGDEPIFGLNPNSKLSQSNSEKVELKIIKPVTIEDGLNEHVIGQDKAKRVLALASYNHAKMVNHNNSDDATPVIDKSNILVVGNSGCGKTYMIEHLSNMLGVPFVKVGASGLTASGYHGKSVDTILAQLWQQCGGDKEKAENAIVFIDEIDKIAVSAGGGNGQKDIGGEVVQQELLKIVEGPEVEFQIGMGATQVINTSNILFIIGGAFNNMADSKEVIKPDDIIEYGFIREFVGRFANIARLDKLSIEDLQNILTKPKNAITKQYSKLVEMDDNTLKFEEAYLKDVAEKAYSLNTGARALRTILDQDLMDVLYESSKNVDKEYIMKLDSVKDVETTEDDVEEEVTLN